MKIDIFLRIFYQNTKTLMFWGVGECSQGNTARDLAKLKWAPRMPGEGKAFEYDADDPAGAVEDHQKQNMYSIIFRYYLA